MRPRFCPARSSADRACTSLPEGPLLHPHHPAGTCRGWPLAILLSLAPVLFPVASGAQETAVSRVQAEPSSFLDRRVEVAGVVVRYLGGGGDGTSTFFIEGDAAEPLRVVTVDPPPPVGTRWVVTGVVVLDSAGNPYLVEASRLEEGLVGAAASSRAGGEDAPSLPSPGLLAALGLGVVVVLLALRIRHARLAARSGPHLIFRPGPSRSRQPPQAAAPDHPDRGRAGRDGERRGGGAGEGRAGAEDRREARGPEPDASRRAGQRA